MHLIDVSRLRAWPQRTARSRSATLLGLAGLLGTAGLVAACGTATSVPHATPPAKAAPTAAALGIPGSAIPSPRVPVLRPPRVIGSAVRPLWQGSPWDVFTVADGLVIGHRYADGRNSVIAVSALTGEGVWDAPIPALTQAGPLPIVRGFVTGASAGTDSVGIIEAAGEVGRAPVPVGSLATTEIAVDMATGRRLWMAGFSQNPPVAVSGNEVLIGSPVGVITARNAETGRVLWTRSRPAGCSKLEVDSPVEEGMGLGADGPLVAASFECVDGSVVVQRLDALTGTAVWTWTSPRETGLNAGIYLTVTGVATAGDLVLLAGQDSPSATSLARLVRRSYVWPSGLGPLLNSEVVLALDAANGRPRWSETGGQLENFTLTDGAVCEVANTGMECRDDVTGAPTSSVVVTGQGGGGMPPYINDRWAGISGGVAAVTVGPFRPGRVTVELVPVRGQRPLGRVVVDVGLAAYHASYQCYVTGAGSLPGGGVVLLLRRVDLPDYPIVALQLTVRHQGNAPSHGIARARHAITSRLALRHQSGWALATPHVRRVARVSAVVPACQPQRQGVSHSATESATAPRCQPQRQGVGRGARESATAPRCRVWRRCRRLRICTRS
jgi:hypothetical protein